MAVAVAMIAGSFFVLVRARVWLSFARVRRGRRLG